MSKKKEHHEEHPDETWLIPYADMLTLLLALFIVMFASSQVDNTKFQQMKEKFGGIFGEGSSIKMSTSGINVDIGDGAKPVDGEGDEVSEAAAEGKKIDEVVKYLDAEIEKAGLTDQIKMEVYRDGLEISIQDSVLFNSGDAAVRPNVSNILTAIAKMLQGIDNDVRVIGHTDNVPIKTAKYQSNWELSAVRSISVMNYLIQTGGLDPKRFIIQGHGEYKPKFDNSTEEGRAKNRRVEIFIVRRHMMPESQIINSNAQQEQ